MLAYVVCMSAAVAALLVAERRGTRAGVWLFKPLASTVFVAAAISAGALRSTYGAWVLAGLLLSWLGDVLLIPRERQAVFRAGVASFLLGHLAFTAAFAVRGVHVKSAVAAGVVVAAAAAVVLRWLAPHVPGAMRPATYAYVCVISVMIAVAIGTHAAAPNAALLAGALAFYFSDLSVARDRFVEHAFVNRLWGLPLYYGAQLLLAYSIVEG